MSVRPAVAEPASGGLLQALLALGAMTVLYLACGTAVIFRMRRQAAASPAPFSATLGELERDLAALRAPA